MASLAATQLWYFDIIGRIFFYDILVIFFIVVFFLNAMLKNTFSINKHLKIFMLFQWGWLFLVSLYSIIIIFSPSNQESYLQFFKGSILLLIYTIFVTFYVGYLSKITPQKRQNIINFIILGVSISAFFSIIHLIIIKKFNIDINKYIWPNISFGLRHAVSELSEKYGFLYRMRGITGGSNQQAAYILTVLPLCSLRAIYRRKPFYILLTPVLTGVFILTMSRSGFIGLFVAVLILILFYFKKLKFQNWKILVFFIIIILALSLIFLDEIKFFVKDRFSLTVGTQTHINLYVHSLMLFLENPLGYGYNNFSVIYELKYGISNYNPHSSWLSFLLETGIIGFVYQLLFFAYITRECLRRNTMLSKAFLASYIAINVASLFCNILSWFYFLFFLTTFFAATVLENNEKPTRFINNNSQL